MYMCVCVYVYVCMYVCVCKMCVSVSPRDYPQNADWIIQPSLKHVDSTANI